MKAGLQLIQDKKFQRVFWHFERVVWILTVVFLVLVSLGLMGGVGFVNHTSATKGDMEIRYPLFARRTSAIDVTVKLNHPSHPAVLLVERSFLNNYVFQKITPEPSRVLFVSDMLRYEFDISKPTKNATVAFTLRPKETTIGIVNGSIGYSYRHLVTIKQLVYP